jgi:hypothetical protein
MKAFLGLIINMGVMPYPNMKDYWSSEWETQIPFFGDVMSFMWEMIPLKKAVRPSKEQENYTG